MKNFLRTSWAVGLAQNPSHQLAGCISTSKPFECLNNDSFWRLKIIWVDTPFINGTAKKFAGPMWIHKLNSAHF